MEFSNRFVFSAQPAGSDFQTEDWEARDLGFIRAWAEAKSILKTKCYSYRGSDWLVEADWEPMLASHKHQTEASIQVTRDSNLIGKGLFQTEPTTIQISCSHSEQDPQRAKNVSRGMIENYLYDVFLIVNISAPGSCNFFGSLIIDENGPNDGQFAIDRTAVNLSFMHFDSWGLEKTGHSWDSPAIISVERTSEWFEEVRNGISQIPTTPISKALFSLWHLSRSDISPVSIVWIFYALESLFATKPGENRSALVRRISALLDFGEAEHYQFKKKFNKAYELRSSIVHGGMKIVHPLTDERFDKSVDAYYSKILESVEFGFAILCKSIQKIVENNWKNLEFIEEVSVIGKK